MATLTFTPPSGYGGTFNETTSSDAQTALALQIQAAIAAAPAKVTVGIGRVSMANPPGSGTDSTTNGYPLTTPLFYSTGQLFGGSLQLTGSAAISAASIILNDYGDTYDTGGTAVSTVVATDGNPVLIVNRNPNGALLAATGSARGNQGNTLEGLAGANQFITGTGGRDAVLMFGVANSLTSYGNDVALVGGPSTITAGGSGTDNVLITPNAVLAFINGSNAGAVDSITGAAGSIVLMAGSGSTSVTAGAGQEYFFLDTSAGNTTINAAGSATAALTFIKDANQGTAAVTVNNFAPGGTVAVHGYASTAVSQSNAPAGGAVLTLSDGAVVTFNGLSTAALTAALRPI